MKYSEYAKIAKQLFGDLSMAFDPCSLRDYRGRNILLVDTYIGVDKQELKNWLNKAKALFNQFEVEVTLRQTGRDPNYGSLRLYITGATLQYEEEECPPLFVYA